MTEHATTFRIIGEYVDKRTGERMTRTGDGVVKLYAKPVTAPHRPLDPGMVYETLAVRGSDHILDFDDSRGCRTCNPAAGEIIDNRRAPQ